MRSGIGVLTLLCVLVLSACRPMPRVDEVRAAVTEHFSGRGYPVVELSVRSISPLATGEKTYMGVPAFEVELDRLVLSVEGREREFRDVSLLLKGSRTEGARYVVSDISGVPLP